MVTANLDLVVTSDVKALKSVEQKIRAVEATMEKVNLVSSKVNNTIKYIANSEGVVQEHVRKTVTNTYELDGAMKTVKNTSTYINSDFERLNQNTANYNNKLKDSTRELREQNQLANKIGTALVGAIAGVVSFKGFQDLMKLSDSMTLSEGKIGLFSDESIGWGVEQVKSAIYDVSQSSRASYESMLSQISKMAINTGYIGQDNSVFADYESLMKFNEVLNQTFVIGGSGFREMNASIYQLTQALSSGRLQGDEFKSLIENAPFFARTVLDYVNTMKNTTLDGTQIDNVNEYYDLTLGQLRDLGAEGEITADVLVNAMLWAADDVNAKFKSIHLTWEQSMTKFKNSVIRAFDPVLNVIQDTVNSTAITSTLTSIGNMLRDVMTVAAPVISVIATVFSALASQWQILLPIVLALGAAYIFEASANEKSIFAKMKSTAITGLNSTAKLINKTATMASTAAEKINAVMVGIATGAINRHTIALRLDTIWEGLKGIKTKISTMMLAANTGAVVANTAAEGGATIAKGIATVATSALTAATAVFNAVLYANPLVWIIGLFALFVGAMFLAMKAMGKLGDSATSIFGMIVGAVMAMASIVYDIFAGIWNGVASIVNAVGGVFGNSNVMGKVDYLDPTEVYAKYYDKVGGANTENEIPTPEYTNVVDQEMLDAMNKIQGNTKDTADNTALNLDIMRELGANQYLSRFGGAPVTNNIVMNATITKDADIDGVIDTLTRKLTEAIDTSTSGYHGA